MEEDEGGSRGGDMSCVNVRSPLSKIEELTGRARSQMEFGECRTASRDQLTSELQNRDYSSCSAAYSFDYIHYLFLIYSYFILF